MWFIVALISFFFLAIAAVVDKFLLVKSKVVPIAYSFYVVVLGGLASSLLLFFASDFYFPRKYLLLLSIGGAAFYFAIYFMYLVVQRHEVSKINPLIVSLTPLFIFFFSFFLAIGSLPFKKIVGVFLLISGSYFLSQVGLPKARLKPKALGLVILACILFAIANSCNKIAYNNLSFITAFVWLRWLALMAAVVATTVLGGWRAVLGVGGRRPDSIIQQAHRVKDRILKYSFKYVSIIFNLEKKHAQKIRRQWLAFGIGQTAGAVGTFLMQYAIKLGNVVLVTALNGVQFFFVILIVYILSKFYPKILRENIQSRFVWQKIFWSIILSVGIILILA